MAQQEPCNLKDPQDAIKWTIRAQVEKRDLHLFKSLSRSHGSPGTFCETLRQRDPHRWRYFYDQAYKRVWYYYSRAFHRDAHDQLVEAVDTVSVRSTTDLYKQVYGLTKQQQLSCYQEFQGLLQRDKSTGMSSTLGALSYTTGAVYQSLPDSRVRGFNNRNAR